MRDPTPGVAICVITYMRPDGLRRLLEGLNDLEFRSTAPDGVHLIVVDNDQGGSGEHICSEMAGIMRWPLTTAIEPRRGIPYARNRALSLVCEESGFVAFIDDDEVPDPLWLDHLLRVQLDFSADVVTGPVVPYFPSPPPRWLTPGRFFDGPRMPTGSAVYAAATNNVLVRSEVFRAVAGGFDERLALTGGSDTQFFMRVHRAGFKTVFAADGVVTEWVPASRVNAKWLLQRAYRIGNTFAHCERSLGDSMSTLVTRGVVGLGLISIGSCSALVRLCLPSRRYRAKLLESLRRIYMGFGMLAGLLGHRYEEYRHVHRV